MRAWTAEDLQSLTDLWGANIAQHKISNILGRSIHHVLAQTRILGLKARTHKRPELPPFEFDGAEGARKRIIKQDVAFQKAMIRAIEAGLEHAVVGVFKDDTPCNPTVFHPDRTHRSSCGSSAAQCSEEGISSSARGAGSWGRGT
jgi:hypothetical protein